MGRHNGAIVPDRTHPVNEAIRRSGHVISSGGSSLVRERLPAMNAEPSRLRLAAAVFLASALAAAAPAAVINVPGDQPTIAWGLMAAQAGDEVVIAPGAYLEHDLVLRSGVILRGATGDPADVVIDSQRLGRCVYGADLNADTRLEALTLANGLPAWGSTPHNSWGGGLMVEDGALTVSNCVFRDNETAIGGGAHVVGTGAPVFEDCVFDGNLATEVAGLLIRGACDPLVARCTFRNGDGAMYSGGVSWQGSGEALMEDCLVESNHGGGLEIFGAATLARCTVRGNTADYGGGGIVVDLYGDLVLEDCLVEANTAATLGGGVWVTGGGALDARDSTILGNTAPIGPDGYVSSSGMATLRCCTFDEDAWVIHGLLVIDNEDCVVAVRGMSWSDVRSLFR
jgi:hypothetical protein